MNLDRNRPFPRSLPDAVSRSVPKRNERGVVLFVALIVLVVMALAGLAMMKQTTSGVSIAGNIALRQNATSAGDYGTEKAIQWLIQKYLALPSDLNSDSATDGYYATWGNNQAGDPTKIDWSQPGVTSVEAITSAAEATGNRVRYVIHRLCANLGAADAIGQKCSDSRTNSGGTRGGGGANYPGGTIDASKPVFRISAQIEGPKSTTSFIQVLFQ